MSDSLWPHRRRPNRLLCPWDSPGKNTGVGCHVLLQCMKVKSESEVTQEWATNNTFFKKDFNKNSSSLLHQLVATILCYAFPSWPSGKESAYQCRRHRFDPWVGKIPWRRKGQPTPVFLPGKFHRQRSLGDYSSCNSKESDTTEQAHAQYSAVLLSMTMTELYINSIVRNETYLFFFFFWSSFFFLLTILYWFCHTLNLPLTPLSLWKKKEPDWRR